MANSELLYPPIPDLNIFKERIIWGGLPIFAIGGGSDSGKNSNADALNEEFGLQSFDTSDYIGEQLEKLGVPPPYNRWQKGERSDEYHKVRGKHIWALLALTDIGRTISKHSESPITGAQILGSRFTEEWAFLRQFENVSLIWLEAPFEVRAKREAERNRPGTLGYEDFKARDEREMKQMAGMKEMADVVIDANQLPNIVNDDVKRFAANRISLYLQNV